MRRSVLFCVCVVAATPAFAQDGAALYTQHCASCHDTGARAPSRAVISVLAPDRIVAALTTGLMRQLGESLTAHPVRNVLGLSGPLADVRLYGSARAVEAAERLVSAILSHATNFEPEMEALIDVCRDEMQTSWERSRARLGRP